MPPLPRFPSREAIFPPWENTSDYKPDKCYFVNAARGVSRCILQAGSVYLCAEVITAPVAFSLIRRVNHSRRSSPRRHGRRAKIINSRTPASRRAHKVIETRN